MGKIAGTELTDKQRDVLEVIEKFIANHNLPPTYSEIANAFKGKGGFYSIQGHIEALAKKGWIKRQPGISRGIEVVRSISKGGKVTTAKKNVDRKGKLVLKLPVGSPSGAFSVPWGQSLAREGSKSITPRIIAAAAAASAAAAAAAAAARAAKEAADEVKKLISDSEEIYNIKITE